MNSLVSCSIGHPYRPVNWRWQRAGLLADNKTRRANRSDQDDKYISQLQKFQKAFAACKDDVDKCHLANKQLSLYYAYEIWSWDQGEFSEKDTNSAKYEIEARLLANESFISIADRLSTSEEVIRWYELAFFNVLDRLKSSSYILHQVMGPAVYRGVADRNFDVLWKLYGYFYGPAVLDALITTCSDPHLIEQASDVDNFFIEDTRSSMRRKSALAARTLPINSYTQISIVELHAKMLEIEQNNSNDSGASTIISNIGAMMNALPLSVGKINESTKLPPELLKYTDTAAELRSDEILNIVNSGEVPDDKLLESFKIPDIVDKKHE